VRGVVYVSTGGVSSNQITERVQVLAQAGFQSIELTGGTLPEKDLAKKLRNWRSTYGLNYLIHNYFPPPDSPFVFNLASESHEIREKSLGLARKAIDLCVEIESPIYSCHAGFFFDPRIAELGGKKRSYRLSPTHEAEERFLTAYDLVNEYAKQREIQIFLENNVLDTRNYQELGQSRAAMLLDEYDYERLSSEVDFNLLLDTGHLKVSATTLGGNFEDEFSKLAKRSDFLQISDNNGKVDQNLGLTRTSDVYRLLRSIAIEEKWLSLEVYDGIDSIQRTKKLLEELIKARRIECSRNVKASR